jgi:hypothetical protein
MSARLKKADQSHHVALEDSPAILRVMTAEHLQSRHENLAHENVQSGVGRGIGGKPGEFTKETVCDLDT